jgi:Arc/MetJ-type ribon-helix-helix transcriptional regulator
VPGQNYKSVSLNDELIERIKQLIEQIGTYHSVSEFVSEAVRLRIETLEKTIKTQEQTQKLRRKTTAKTNTQPNFPRGERINE